MKEYNIFSLTGLVLYAQIQALFLILCRIPQANFNLKKMIIILIS